MPDGPPSDVRPGSIYTIINNPPVRGAADRHRRWVAELTVGDLNEVQAEVLDVVSTLADRAQQDGVTGVEAYGFAAAAKAWLEVIEDLSAITVVPV